MNIEDVEIGKPYVHVHAYGQPDENVICIRKINDGGHPEVIVQYEDGRTSEFNRIECERYLFPR